MADSDTKLQGTASVEGGVVPSPTGTAGTEPTYSQVPSPTGTTGTEPMFTQVPSPTGTTGTEPTYSQVPSSTGTMGTEPIYTQVPSPTGTTGTEPTYTQAHVDRGPTDHGTQPETTEHRVNRSDTVSTDTMDDEDHSKTEVIVEPETNDGDHVEPTQTAEEEPTIKGPPPKTTPHVTYSEGVDQLEWKKAMKNGDQEYRVVFKNEMHRLHRELETFNEEISREYEKNTKRIGKKKKALEDELNELEQRRINARKQLEEEQDSLRETEAPEQQRQQQAVLIEREVQLLDREEKLTSRQQQLVEYEAEIEKIEGYLDRRMDIARRRNTELMELDGAQRVYIQQQEATNTQTDDVTPDADNIRAPASPAAPAGSAQCRLLQEKNVQLELVLKKAKADLAHSENARQHLHTQVSGLEKAQEQSTKRVAELERHMFLNQTNLSSSQNRMNPHPEAASDNQSQDDLPSLADSNMLHTGVLPATAGHPESNSMKPGRVFKIKIKPSRTPSLHSAPASPTAATEHNRFTERPALTWQQHEPRRQQRGSRRGITTHTSPLPTHHPKLAPTPPPPAQGDGAHGEVRHQTEGSLRGTWSDTELLRGENVPPRSAMCVVQ